VILESKTVARSMLRKARLTVLAHRIRMLWHKTEYEDRFSEALLAAVRPEDCVWDIGANVGFYTERLAVLTRHVIAFEPVVENVKRIEAKVMRNVECLQIAVGDITGEASMFVDGPFSSLALSPHPNTQRRTVRVVRGDDLTSLQQPTVVKIDVEGFEVETVRGMHRVLGGVRAVFVELHFQILEDRGMRQAPSTLVKELRSLGFDKIEWPDASHIAAFRAEWSKTDAV
jgi:FkbM family methyltransferase